MINGNPLERLAMLQQMRATGVAQPIQQGLLRAPRLPGVLGAQPEPKQPSILQRIGGGINTLSGHENDPRLSPEQNAAMAKRSRLMAGLAILSSDAPGLQGIAQGLMYGQQSGQQARQEAITRQQMQQVAQASILPNMDPETVNGAIQQLLPLAAQGNPDAARMLSTLLQVSQQAGARDDRALTREQQQDQFRQTMADRQAARDEAARDREEARNAASADRRQQADIARQDRLVNVENSLADDFDRNAASATEVAGAIGSARAAADNKIGDQTLIIALNKVLDPSSIVKEGEFERVGKAGGLASRAQFFYSQLGKDGRLPPELRGMIEAEIEALATQRQAAFRRTIDRYSNRATRAGVDPAMVVYDPFGASPETTTNPFR